MSETLTKSFWKYASTVKGISTIEDTFEQWASKQAATMDDLNDTWLSVQVDVQTAFNKTAAGEVEIKGDPDAIKEMFQKGNVSTAPINAPKIESPLGAIKQTPGGPKPPSGPIGGLPGAGGPPSIGGAEVGGPPPIGGAPAGEGGEPDLMDTLGE